MNKWIRTADLHCDTVLEQLNCKETGKEFHPCVQAEKLEEAGYLLQTFALFTDYKGKRVPEHQVMRLYLEYLRMLEENPNLKPILSRADLDEVVHSSRCGALLSLEEGDVMFQDPELLELWYRFGVRMIALCWNYDNAIGTPNIRMSNGDEYKKGRLDLVLETETGLSEYGKAYVKKMEDLGILVDVSHLSDAGFWNVISFAQKPVIASHSNSRAECRVSRNLDDEMMKAIARTGGVMGINFCGDFLNNDGQNFSRVEDMVRHILHMKEVAGIDHIAIGTDFDGIASRLEINGIMEMQKLYEALEAAGLDHEEIEKIAWKNVVRVLRSVLK